MKLQLIDKKTLNIHGYERVENGEWRNRGVNESKDSYGNGVYRGDYMRRQYTGIKDKNGVEIFDGDIVTFQHQKYDKNARTAVFIYSGKNAAFMLIGTTQKEEKYISALDTAIDTIKVIGNIYQNPDLLEK